MSPPSAVPPSPVAPPSSPVPPPSEPPVAVDLLLRVLGMLLALVGGVVAAALAVILIPLRVGSFGWAETGIGTIRLPVAIALAGVGNLLLVWFARHATGVRWAALLPGIGWFAVIVMALRTTTEGDRLLMPDDWVGTLTLFTGTIVLVIGTMLTLTPSRARTTYHRGS